MSTITLRQSSGNTQPRSANVSVKNSPLQDYEVDNNFNNLNNDIELNSGLVELAYNTANTKFSSNGGAISGDVIISGVIQANSYYGVIDAGSF